MLPASALLPKEIFRSEHFAIVIDEQDAIVRIIRSATAFASLTEVEDAYTAIIGVLDTLDRHRYALLIDVRAGPGRNDPAFEATLRNMRPRWFKGFRQVAAIVQTVSGLLQLRRLAKEDGHERMVSMDEGEVMRHLRKTR